jgi:predicted TIM-barrel fold metal-dependent hydrolase
MDEPPELPVVDWPPMLVKGYYLVNILDKNEETAVVVIEPGSYLVIPTVATQLAIYLEIMNTYLDTQLDKCAKDVDNDNTKKDLQRAGLL